jgi:hypothetical protein
MLPSGVPSADWVAVATRAIEALEYQASPCPGGFQAPNPAHGLRTTFRDRGIEITPREEKNPAGRVAWTTTGYGRTLDRPLASVSACAPIRVGDRIEYQHGAFTEWYRNDRNGLEQGFTIHEAPFGQGIGDAPLCIGGVFAGPMRATVIDGGDAIELKEAPTAARSLRYGHLLAADATGRELPSRFELAESAVTECATSLRIIVDDRNAIYPVEIDPLFETPNWTFDGESGSRLGVCRNVGDLNGDGYSDVAIGASHYDHDSQHGRVYVFYGSPSGLSAIPDWHADGDQAGGLLGYALSGADFNGDGYSDLLVAAPWRVNGGGLFGRVSVYLGSASGLSDAPSQHLTGHIPDLRFGRALSTGDFNGDGYYDALIGCYDYYGTLGGGVWVHNGGPGGLGPAHSWFTASDDPASDYGYSVSSAGDVNADGYDDVLVGSSPLGGTGRAYLYLGSAGGASTIADWIHDGESEGSRFGAGVAGVGDTDGDGYADVVIAEPNYAGPELDEGRAYLFRGTPTGLESTPSWSDEGDQEGAYFGGASAAGDVNGDGLADVLIGATWWDGDVDACGRVFLYYGSRAGLAPDPVWTAAGDQEACMFGAKLSTAGDVNGDGFSDVLVGAIQEGSADNHGRAYMWLGSADGPRRTPGWVIESNQAGAGFGYAISGCGDVNGDGYDDLIVGAPGYDYGQVDEGAAFVFLGHSGGPSVLPDWYAQSDQTGASFGSSVASAGDVNGDGYDDVLVGSPSYDAGATDAGAAFLWLGTAGGSAPGTPSNAAWMGANNQAGALCGFSVACAGDVNADGYADVVIGSPMYSQGQTHEGAAGVYLGRASGLSSGATWIGQSNQAEAHYGRSVAGAGDVNCDGYTDLLIGAPHFDNPEVDEGIVRLYYGTPGGVSGTAAWYAEPNEDGARFGWAVSSAGDVNGDAFSDIVIGAPDGSYGGVRGGIYCIWHGGPAGPSGHTPAECDYHGYSALAGAEAGIAVATAGDLNLDGYSDVLIGIPHLPNPDTGTPDCGGVVVHCGSADGVTGDFPSIAGVQSGAGFATELASADLNGDGFPDVIVGASSHTNPEAGEGRAFIYYGNDSRGLARAPDQLQPTLDSPIGLRGVSSSLTSVGVRALARTPAGRGVVRLEWEVKPFRVPFDGTGLQHSSFRDTGVPVVGEGSAVLITRVATGLASGTPCHLRMRIISENPRFPHSPWFSPSGNAPTELDFRTGGANADAGESAEGTAPAALLRALPNPLPAGVACTIRFRGLAADVPGPARIDVYDVQGRLVRTVLNEIVPAGRGEVAWDGTGNNGARLPNGVYWIRAVLGSEMRSTSVVVE